MDNYLSAIESAVNFEIDSLLEYLRLLERAQSALLEDTAGATPPVSKEDV